MTEHLSTHAWARAQAAQGEAAEGPGLSLMGALSSLGSWAMTVSLNLELRTLKHGEQWQRAR